MFSLVHCSNSRRPLFRRRGFLGGMNLASGPELFHLSPDRTMLCAGSVLGSPSKLHFPASKRRHRLIGDWWTWCGMPFITLPDGVPSAHLGNHRWKRTCFACSAGDIGTYSSSTAVTTLGLVMVPLEPNLFSRGVHGATCSLC
jgi:hypothetical protein